MIGVRETGKQVQAVTLTVEVEGRPLFGLIKGSLFQAGKAAIGRTVLKAVMFRFQGAGQVAV